MRPKFLISLAVAFLGCFAHADNAITFSPGLPKPWTLLSSQTIPGTNTDTHASFTANITVIQDPKNLTTMLISVAPASAAQMTNNLAADASTWVQGVLNRFGETGNITITKVEVQNENHQTFAETAFTIQLQDTSLYGISRYSIVKTNAIGWVAFGASNAIETNKTVLGIAGSIRIRK
jgi:hypothetical protein